MRTDERTCPACGGGQYRALNETIGATGSLRSQVVWRHDDTGRIGCPS